MRILVVDDSKANRNIARVLLENAGHVVAEAEGGARAIERVSTEAFDVVLMDIAMPDVDGLSATRAIRALKSAAASIPIVAWTAHDVPGMRSQTCSAGMDAYLTKPIIRATLLSTIDAFDTRAGLQQFQDPKIAST
ncbi:response regulator [Minwuia sp.]|uniref:response regulator n=1 Tax=Minwuia sp. TaxID=2493630 RepID=UPI003A91DE94